jgi:CheY-like chemotaxis protein
MNLFGKVWLFRTAPRLVTAWRWLLQSRWPRRSVVDSIPALRQNSGVGADATASDAMAAVLPAAWTTVPSAWTLPGSDRTTLRAGLEASVAALRVLVVDDNRINRLYLSRLLEGIGVVVTSGQDGCDAVSLVGQHAFDLVLMDLSMPVLDGLSATRLIREREAAGAFPDRCRLGIIGLSAQAGCVDRLAIDDAGMDGYLSKPFARDELLAVICSVHRSMQRHRRLLPAPVSAASMAE